MNMHGSKKIRIAFAGNPNVGKTTLFNTLTGSHQHVGNWPGKTVEKKEGYAHHKGYDVEIVDLPGIYSMSAYSAEEIVARNYILDERPDVVVNVADSCNIERNLYLTVQLIELGANVVLALNMSKAAENQGIDIDEEKVGYFLGIPVVKIDAKSTFGADKMMDAVISAAAGRKERKPVIKYGNEIDEHTDEIAEMIKAADIQLNYEPKWVAIKLLENDPEVVDKIRVTDYGRKIIAEAEKKRKHLEDVFGDNFDNSIADGRYGFIAGVLAESVEKKDIDRISASENIDRILTNRALGIPIFLAIMWAMFTLTFVIGAPFTEIIDRVFRWLSECAGRGIVEYGGPVWVKTLVVDGIIGGVGSVFVFVPNIFILFFMIAIMEDSGYMARAAFIMDRVMHKIGLHGKSFIPMIIGFGCNVPAIMASRTLENEKDRILTILITPFMSCSARLPVYILFVSAFFAENQGTVIFLIYLTGVSAAIVSGFIFKNTMFKGLSSPFVMELPPYRWPALKGALIHTWERGKMFVMKVGTVIFSIMIVIWLLASMPPGVEYASQGSLIGQAGTAIAPLLEPAGFGNWQAAVALMFGFAAKEVIVGAFGTLYGAEEEGLIQAIRNNFTPLSGAAFIVMALLYVPCVSAVAAIRRETNSLRWALLVVVYTTAVAWICAVAVYQIGILLGLS